MKRKTIIMMSTLALLVGCATQKIASSRGPACGQEELFRQELAASKPVKEWGYSVEDVRFSNNYQRAIVVFAAPDKAPARREAVLDYDGKSGYCGRIVNPDLPHSNPLTIGDLRAMTADVVVNLPVK